MPCFRPIPAWQNEANEVFLWRQPKRGDKVKRELQLPCGGCEGCLLERSRNWAIRCMHEARQWENNCFITLTYKDVPNCNSLNHAHFQRFMKVFRDNYQGAQPYVDPRTNKVSHPIRYYMAGEYGSRYGRPHYHACIFNFDFKDREYLCTTNSGSKLFRSAQLEELWSEGKGSNRRSLGFSSIGDVTFESAAYVARYVMKKAQQEFDASYTDEHTGEYYEDVRVPEYNRMSLRPGIGATWLDQYKADVYPHDEVIVNGFPTRPPRYYDKRLEEFDPDMYEAVGHERVVRGLKKCKDNTPERLGARQSVLKAKLQKLVRTY